MNFEEELRQIQGDIPPTAPVGALRDIPAVRRAVALSPTEQRESLESELSPRNVADWQGAIQRTAEGPRRQALQRGLEDTLQRRPTATSSFDQELEKIQSGAVPMQAGERTTFAGAPEGGSEYWKALKRAFLSQNPEMGYRSAQAHARAVGLDQIADWASGKATEARASGESLEPRISDVRDIKSLSDAWDYIAQAAGQAVGTSAFTIAGALLGGAVTGGRGAAPSAMAGRALGAAVPSWVLNSGDVFGDAVDDPAIQRLIKEGKLTEAQVARVALGFSIPVAALDTASMATLLGGASNQLKKQALDAAKFGFKNYLATIAKEGAKGAAIEGATEAAQKVIAQWARDTLGGGPVDFQERFFEALNEGIAGMLGGAQVRGGAAAVTTRISPPAGPDGGFREPGKPVSESLLTHRLEDGTRVRPIVEKGQPVSGLWENAQGEVLESERAEPIKKPVHNSKITINGVEYEYEVTGKGKEAGTARIADGQEIPVNRFTELDDTAKVLLGMEVEKPKEAPKAAPAAPTAAPAAPAPAAAPTAAPEAAGALPIEAVAPSEAPPTKPLAGLEATYETTEQAQRAATALADETGYGHRVVPHPDKAGKYMVIRSKPQKILGKPVEKAPLGALRALVEYGDRGTPEWEAASEEVARRTAATIASLEKAAKKRGRIDPTKDTVATALAKLGGLNVSFREEVSGEKKGVQFFVPSVGPLFRSDGLGIDDAATQLSQMGFMSPAEMEDVDGGVAALLEKLSDEVRGIRKHYSLSVEAAAFEKEREANERAREEMEREAIDKAGPTPEEAPAAGAELEILEELARIDPDAVERIAIETQDAPYEEFLAKAKEYYDGIQAKLRQGRPGPVREEARAAPARPEQAKARAPTEKPRVAVGPIRAPEEPEGGPVRPEAGPQVTVLDLSMAELVRRGWNPQWPFVAQDLFNPSFRAAIQQDPELSDQEKRKILSFGPGGANEITLRSLEQPRAPYEPGERLKALKEKEQALAKKKYSMAEAPKAMRALESLRSEIEKLEKPAELKLTAETEEQIKAREEKEKAEREAAEKEAKKPADKTTADQLDLFNTQLTLFQNVAHYEVMPVHVAMQIEQMGFDPESVKVITTREEYSNFRKQFGLPNALLDLSTRGPAELEQIKQGEINISEREQMTAFGRWSPSLFVDDEQDGKPVAVYIPRRVEEAGQIKLFQNVAPYWASERLYTTEKLPRDIRKDAELTVGQDYERAYPNLKWRFAQIPIADAVEIFEIDEHAENEYFEEESQKLAEQIKETGNLQAVVVGPGGTEGFHRVRAAQILGRKTVPAYVFVPDIFTAMQPTGVYERRKYAKTTAIKQVSAEAAVDQLADIHRRLLAEEITEKEAALEVHRVLLNVPGFMTGFKGVQPTDNEMLVAAARAYESKGAEYAKRHEGKQVRAEVEGARGDQPLRRVPSVYQPELRYGETPETRGPGEARKPQVGPSRELEEPAKWIARLKAKHGEKWADVAKRSLKELEETLGERPVLGEVTKPAEDWQRQKTWAELTELWNALLRETGEVVPAPQAKGTRRVAGFDVRIETLAGERRRPEWPALQDDYGEIVGVVGKDKDYLDVFINEGTPSDFSGTVFVVNQTKADGSFDEHKVLLGYESLAAARRAYQRNYEPKWERGRSIVPISMPAFKIWAADRSKAGPKGGRLTLRAIRKIEAGLREISAAPGEVLPQGEAPAQRDLFGAYPVPSETPTPEVREGAARFEHVVVVSERTGTVRLPAGKITNKFEAAQAFNQLAKSPRERFQVIGLDANQQPIAYFDLFAGTLTQTPTFPREVMLNIAALPGVKSVWLAHNHPQGLAEPSRQDESMTGIMEEAVEQTGAKLAGSIIVAGRNAIEITEAVPAAFRVPSIDRGWQEVPLMERVIQREDFDNRHKPLSSPKDAKHYLSDVLAPKEDGLLFLDAANRPIAWYPMDLEEMKRISMSDMNTIARLLRQISRNNPASAFVVGKGGEISSFDAVFNRIEQILRLVDVRLHDAFVGDELSSVSAFRFKQEEAPYESVARVMGEGSTVEQLHEELKGSKLYQALWGRIEIVPNGWHVPRRVFVHLPLKDGFPRSAGVFDRGRIYLIANNIEQGDALRVLIHEAVGHMGIENVLKRTQWGMEVVAVLQEIYDARRVDINREVRTGYLQKWNLDVTKPAGQWRAAAEWIAVRAEAQEEQALWKRLVGAIRNWLRQLGAVKEWTDNDILHLLTLSRYSIMNSAISVEGMPSHLVSVFEQARAEYTPERFIPMLTAELRDALKRNDYLGFDSAQEAAGAILENEDWKSRWSADVELQRVGDAWRQAAGAIDRSMLRQPRAPYGRAPDWAMGFRKTGPQRGFGETRYPIVQAVRVTLPSGEVFEDAIEGMNQAHALERARRNWEGARVDAIGDPEARQTVAPYESVPPATVGNPNPRATIREIYAVREGRLTGIAVRSRFDGTWEVRTGAGPDLRIKGKYRSRRARDTAEARRLLSAFGELRFQPPADVPPMDLGVVWSGGQSFELEDTDLSQLGKFAVHPRTIASFDRDLAPVVMTLEAKAEYRDQIISELFDTMKPFFDASAAVQRKVSAVLEIERLKGEIYGTGTEPVVATNTGQKAVLSKRGDRFRLNDEEKSAHWAVRRGMDQALDFLRDERVREHGLDPAAIRSPEQVLAAIPAGATDAVKNNLKRLAQDLVELRQLRRTGYVPFSRWGAFGIAVRNREGKTIHFEQVESFGKFFSGKKAIARADELRREYPNDVLVGPFYMTPARATEIVDFGLLDNLASVARLDPEQYEAVREKLLEAQRTRGFARHLMRAENIPGYSSDFTRAIADYVVGLASYSSRRRYREQLESDIGSIPAHKKRLYDYARVAAKYADSPQEEYQLLRQTNYVYYLAAVPMTAGANLTQPLLTTFPILTSLSNPVKATMLMERAYRNAINMTRLKPEALLSPNLFFDPKKAPQDVREGLTAAWEKGILAPMTTMEMMGLARNRAEQLRRLTRRTRYAVEFLAHMFMTAERTNRIVTYIAGYRLAAEPGMRARILESLKNNGLAMQALGAVSEQQFPAAFAEYLIDETQFRTGKVNRATLQRGPGTAIFQFKDYPWQMIELYMRMGMLGGTRGKVALALMLLLLGTTAGLWGLPFADNLRKLFEFLYKGITDRDLDLRLAVRDAITDMTDSPRLAEAASAGVFRYMDDVPDLSTRIGLGNILPNLNDPASYLGVPFDLLWKRGEKAAQWLKRDEYGMAAAAVAPNWIKNWIEAEQWKETGIRSQAYGSLIVAPEDLDALDIWMKRMGGRSRKVAELSESEYAQQRASHAVDDMRRAFTYRIGVNMARAMRAGEAGDFYAQAAAEEKVADAWATLERHNEQRPIHEQVIINANSLKRRIEAELLGPALGRDVRAPKAAREERKRIEERYYQP